MFFLQIKSTILSKKYWRQIFILNDAKIKSLYGTMVMGKFWMTIKPIVQIIFIGFIFGNVIGIKQENYSAFIMYNLLTLNLISNCISQSSASIVESLAIIKRFNINKTIFPVSVVFNNLYIYFFCMFFCTLLLSIISNIPLHFNMIFAPLYFGYIIITLMLVCISISIIYPYFKDIGFLIDNATMIAIWVTPIFYPISKMPEWMFKLSYFNPFFILIAPFTRLMHAGLLPTLSMHIAMFGLFIVSFLIYIIVSKKLSRNLIYHC